MPEVSAFEVKPLLDSNVYSKVRAEIRDGDLAIFRNVGLISRYGRGLHSHAATCTWRCADQDSLSLAETREGYGGRVVSLRHEIELHPGSIDIYTPIKACPSQLRDRAATIAYNWSGHGYAYAGIGRMAAVHSPLLRHALEALGVEFDFTDLTPSPWEEAKVCSQLHAWSYRLAKLELGMRDWYDWDPAPMLGDRWVEPCDLTRSGGYQLLAKELVIH